MNHIWEFMGKHYVNDQGEGGAGASLGRGVSEVGRGRPCSCPGIARIRRHQMPRRSQRMDQPRHAAARTGRAAMEDTGSIARPCQPLQHRANLATRTMGFCQHKTLQNFEIWRAQVGDRNVNGCVVPRWSLLFLHNDHCTFVLINYCAFAWYDFTRLSANQRISLYRYLGTCDNKLSLNHCCSIIQWFNHWITQNTHQDNII